jgi:hypothetical protein
MKKILLSVVILVILALVAIYWLVPASPSIDASIGINANPSVTTRILREASWKLWWPSSASSKDSILELNNQQFSIIDKQYNSLKVLISKEQFSFGTSLNIIPLSLDSVRLEWIGRPVVANSPVKRIQQYNASKEIRESLRLLLDTLRSFLEQPANTYDLHIIQEKVKDTLLITRKSVLKSYPDIATVYEMVNSLHAYAKKRGLNEMNYPMLHVLKLDKDEYSTMVAIPVDREVPTHDGIAFKRMAPGNILVTEVRGGPYTIQRAFTRYEEYLQDYHRISPALPFESMVTDRIAEPDTTKWVTKIYYPVF